MPSCGCALRHCQVYSEAAIELTNPLTVMLQELVRVVGLLRPSRTGGAIFCDMNSGLQSGCAARGLLSVERAQVDVAQCYIRTVRRDTSRAVAVGAIIKITTRRIQSVSFRARRNPSVALLYTQNRRKQSGTADIGPPCFQQHWSALSIASTRALRKSPPPISPISSRRSRKPLCEW